MKLQLEVNTTQVKDPQPFGTRILVTPPIGEEGYWTLRVKVSKNQAIICFPKFMTLGVGFEKEKADWNTNLPWCCSTTTIWEHIKKNKGRGPKEADCIEAIKMIQQGILDHKLMPDSKNNPFTNPVR